MGSTPHAHALAEVGDYVAAIQSTTPPNPSVRDESHFRDILTDAVKALPNLPDSTDTSASRSDSPLGLIIALAAPACSIENLLDVPQQTWEPLVALKRIPTTFDNVSAYIDDVGAIDEPLADLLSQTRKITGIGDDPSLGVDLARTVLQAKATLPDPALRVALVASMHDRMRLEPGDVPSEPGELVGLLINSRILADDPAAFATPPIPDWPTREFAIRQSGDFANFMTPDILPADQLQAFLESQLVPQAAKRKVFDALGDYCQTATPTVATAVAEYGAANALQVGVSDLEYLIEKGADAKAIAALMANALPPIEELRRVLRLLDGDYAVIADPGTRRPTFEATPAHRAMLDKLQAEGPVSSYPPESGGRRLRVSLRHA